MLWIMFAFVKDLHYFLVIVSCWKNVMFTLHLQ